MKSLVANWKMNWVDSVEQNFIKPVEHEFPFEKAQCVICPPSIMMPMLNHCIADKTKISLGLQNISQFESGAYTGEISAKMAVAVGAKFVIVGHSERRQYFAEHDAQIYNKAIQAQKNGLTPIICIGENLEQRQTGQLEAVLEQQLELIVENLSGNIEIRGEAGSVRDRLTDNFYIAYEPVWAIGTGQVATVAEISQTHGFIREILSRVGSVAGTNLAKKIKILYGGSLKPDNAKEILALDNVDGGLIGGASLSAKDYLAIANAAP